MATKSETASVTSHKDWPQALERITRYMQASGLSVSEQTRVLDSVISTFDARREFDNLCPQAMHELRQAMKGNADEFAQSLVAQHFGFQNHRDLQTRHWSMPAMRRSAMLPSRRPDPVVAQWTGTPAKSNAT